MKCFPIALLLVLVLFMAAVPVFAADMPLYPETPPGETPEAALARIVSSKLVVNAHEHAENMDDVPRMLAFKDTFGIKNTVLLGSSHFTITLNPSVGFTRYDLYNENMLAIHLAHPDRFEAWPTINPVDPQMVTKLEDLVKRGATGLKLYTGHGYINSAEQNYLFHPVAMDDARMFPLYEYLERANLPAIWHVNPGPTKPGFAQEFIEVLNLFPDMRIICPHFLLSSIKDSRMREFLDTFPNVYSDVSFGHDDFLIAGLRRISKDTPKFLKIFQDYPSRFMFGTDLVITNHPAKTPEWAGERVQAYYDMLTKKTYTAPFIIDRATGQPEVLNGLEITSPLLDNILYYNYERFMKLDPEGTKITRDLKWSNFGVERVERAPGQAFPPPK
jgi:predicted TIM-barrel fold metal-dependent hydrolase